MHNYVPNIKRLDQMIADQAAAIHTQVLAQRLNERMNVVLVLGLPIGIVGALTGGVLTIATAGSVAGLAYGAYVAAAAVAGGVWYDRSHFIPNNRRAGIQEIQGHLKTRTETLITAIHGGESPDVIDFVLNGPLGDPQNRDIAYQYPDDFDNDTNLVKPIAIDDVLDLLCRALSAQMRRAKRVEIRNIDLSLGQLTVKTLNTLLTAGMGQFNTTTLVLSHNPSLGEVGIFRLRDAILREQAFPHLTTLDVRGTALNRDSLQALREIRDFLGLMLLTDDDFALPEQIPPNLLPQHRAAQRLPAAGLQPPPDYAPPAARNHPRP